MEYCKKSYIKSFVVIVLGTSVIYIIAFFFGSIIYSSEQNQADYTYLKALDIWTNNSRQLLILAGLGFFTGGIYPIMFLLLCLIKYKVRKTKEGMQMKKAVFLCLKLTVFVFILCSIAAVTEEKFSIAYLMGGM